MIDYSPYIEGLRRREAEGKATLEKRRQKAFTIARQIADMLRRDFGATEVYLFGSVLHPDEFHAHSDIDLAVDGIVPARYLTAVAKALIMAKEFSVDLVDIAECQPEFEDSILTKGIKL
jgi:predicted nucleotidyltransferase